jgi:hypothetical protein
MVRTVLNGVGTEGWKASVVCRSVSARPSSRIFRMASVRVPPSPSNFVSRACTSLRRTSSQS